MSIKYALPGEPDSGPAEACLLLAAAGGAAVEAADSASVYADCVLRAAVVVVAGAAEDGAESIGTSRLVAELSDRDCRQQHRTDKLRCYCVFPDAHCQAGKPAISLCINASTL